MLSTFSYYILLLLIIIFYLLLFFINLKKTPKKIKPAMGIFIFLAVLKNIFLLFMVFTSLKISIEVAKIIGFLDLLYIPAIIIILFYIFWRTDKVKFNKINIILGVMTLTYFGIMLILKAKFNIRWEFGYVIEMGNNYIFKAIYLIIFLALLISVVLFKFNETTNILGMNILLGLISVLILENLAYILGLRYFPYCLFSELFLIGITFYGFRTFKS